MKKYILPLSFLLVVLFPSLLFSFLTKKPIEIEEAEAVSSSSASVIQESVPLIRVKHQETVIELALEEYVLSVLLGEVPASFEPEALMAQAVATRTYTLRKVERQNKHDDADVCTDAACCQAFTDISVYLSEVGTETDLEKMQSAVYATAGQVLTYEGNLIEATYFSCSGGRTEDAVDVWGTSIPYLKSVSSPGEEEAKYFEYEYRYSLQAFRSKLGLSDSLPITEANIAISYTEGGGVDQMTIAGIPYSGTEIRSLLSLPSTAFTLSVADDEVLIKTKGNGHRVGMSQYGADAMAVSGKTYGAILSHYYPGTKLEIFTADQMQALFDKAGNL